MLFRKFILIIDISSSLKIGLLSFGLNTVLNFEYVINKTVSQQEKNHDNRHRLILK